MSMSVFIQIKNILDSRKISYNHLVHDLVKTSEDAAKIRGTKLGDAAKALVCKAHYKDGTHSFIQAVIPADKRLALKKLKAFLDLKNLSLASPDEVLERTGCTVGSVPPFGNLFGLKIYADESLFAKERIVFSAGTHTDSMILKPQDYLIIVEPCVLPLVKDD